MKQHWDGTDEEFCRHVVGAYADRLMQNLGRMRRRLTRKGIHDTRVASRRLRAALEAFEDLFAPRPWKTLSGQVRQVTKMLGPIREAEVNLSLLKDLSNAGDMAENLCREYLEERLSAGLTVYRKKIKQKLGRLDDARIRARTDFALAGICPAEAWFADGSRGPARRSRRAGSPAQRGLFELHASPLSRAERILVEYARPVLEFRLPESFPRASDEELHALRLRVKKLRYAMEIFSPVWPGGLEREIRLTKEAQDAGGAYHDWCMLRDSVRAESRRLTRKKTRHLSFQLDQLISEVEGRAKELRVSIEPSLESLQSALRAQLLDRPPVDEQGMKPATLPGQGP